MSIVLDVTSEHLLATGALIGVALVLVGLAFTPVAGPEIRRGTFAVDGGGLLAVSDVSCSTDSDCPSTTCDGTEYLVDTDGWVECADDAGDSDHEEECSGYDESYADANYCGGRYDYNCDGSGCDGYKAACEDDCSANSGCDTYRFCSSETDTDDSDSESTATSDSQTSTCTDACTSLAKRCSADGVEQCQDTDGDGCTDGYVTVATCQSCTNGACTTTTTTANESTETEVAEEVDPAPTDPTGSQTFVQRLREVYQRVLVALLGGL